MKKDTRLSPLVCTASDRKLGGTWELGCSVQCWSVSLVAQLHVRRLFGRAKEEIVAKSGAILAELHVHSF